jgi:peptide/nickel transport system substrate-binding protein
MPKHSAIRKLALGTLTVAYVAGLMFIGAKLFFEDQVALLVNYINPPPEMHASADNLVIGYAYKPASLDPALFDPVTRSYLVDLYEGLVQTDRNLKIKPSLAVSWGLLDPTTWEFRLRPGVKFHDGQELSVNDVIASIERARTASESQLVNLLSTVESVTASGGDKLVIKTRFPDPLLLNKLAVTLIHPASMKDFSKPVGTGPYALKADDETGYVLETFPGYWGGQPYFRKVTLVYVPGRIDRMEALKKGEIQLLANVPPNYACSKTDKYRKADGCYDIANDAIVIKSIPSLEVSFIVFNHRHKLFERREVRQAVSRIFDQQVFVDLAYGFARPVGQFVSSGVFGFNPEIGKPECQPEEAKAQFLAACTDIFETIDVTFDYPEGLETIGQYVQTTLRDLGMNVILNPMSGEDLQKKIMTGESEIYFLGWRSELGSSFDFMQSVAHSRNPSKGYGAFNGARYSNKKVDALIETSERNLDTESRLKQLQEAMKILVDDDIYGVPLYESETVFAFYNWLKFDPRVDGYIHASEIYADLNQDKT